MSQDLMEGVRRTLDRILLKDKKKRKFGGYSECFTTYVDIHNYIPKGVGNPKEED